MFGLQSYEGSGHNYVVNIGIQSKAVAVRVREMYRMDIYTLT